MSLFEPPPRSRPLALDMSLGLRFIRFGGRSVISELEEREGERPRLRYGDEWRRS